MWGRGASRRSVLLGGLVLTGTVGGLVRPPEARAGPGVTSPPIIGCDEWGARPPAVGPHHGVGPAARTDHRAPHRDPERRGLLLRAAGLTDVRPNGRFDERTVAAVRRYQQAHRTEEINGLIGGETWPLLVTVRGADQEEAALAVRALTPDGAVRASALPGRDEWKCLLSAAERRP